MADYSNKDLSVNRDLYIEQSRRTFAGARAELPPEGFTPWQIRDDAEPMFVQRLVEAWTRVLKWRYFA